MVLFESKIAWLLRAVVFYEYGPYKFMQTIVNINYNENDNKISQSVSNITFE